jgi:amino acid transporter
MAWGPDDVLAVAGEDPGAMILRTTLLYLGPVGELVINVLLITSMFACVLSFHNVITRYQHTMSNAGVLPGRLGGVHPKHLSPHTSSLVQSATAAILIVVFAVLGLDPVLQVFTWFAGVATLAIAILMAVTSLAVIVYFARTKQDRRLWNTVVAPGLGFIGLVGSAVVIVVYFPMLVGDVDAGGNPVFGTVSAVLLALIAVCPVVGLVQAAYLRRRRPAAYADVMDAIGG